MSVSATILLLLTTIALTFGPAFGQQAYSESITYEAREVSKLRKQKGKKPKPPALPAGDLVIPVAVQDRTGNFITNLAKEDLTVFLDNVPLGIVGTETAKDNPANIVLLFDTSASIESLIKSITGLAEAMINDLGPDDRMMIATFNEDMRVRQEFTSDKALLRKSLSEIRFGSGTSFYDAVSELVTKKLAGEPGRTHVIVFTDGVDTTSRRSDFESSLVEAERGNVTFFPVYLDTFPAIHSPSKARTPPGFPPVVMLGRNMAGMAAAEYQLGRDYLNDLTIATGGRPLVFSSEPDGQQKIRTSIMANIRSTYFVRVNRPPGSADVKRHALRVRVAKPDVRVYAPGSYLTGY